MCRIETVLGTLEDSVLELLDRQGYITGNDDYGDSPAARLLWQALENGPYWIVVSGYGTGTYELVVQGDSR